MMDDLLTQAEVERRLDSLDSQAEELVHELAAAARAAASAEAVYRRAFAEAILSTTAKTVGEREALATVRTADEYERRKTAEGVLLALQEASRLVRSRMSGMQSVLAGIRDQTTGR